MSPREDSICSPASPYLGDGANIICPMSPSRYVLSIPQVVFDKEVIAQPIFGLTTSSHWEVCMGHARGMVRAG